MEQKQKKPEQKQQKKKRSKHKHNKKLTGTARALRKRMTKEERHLWHDHLKKQSVRFFASKSN